MSIAKAKEPAAASRPSSGEAHAAVPIRLQELTKKFPGSKEPAVERVDMDIPAGEIVVFVGPSGCGKTTTMRMINRLIEPTSGRILIGEDDAMRLKPDTLRRRIGYVIQQIGLLPHLTIAENVGTVPKLLGWDKKRTAARTEELLELVGLPSAEFAKRYPRQLSGGQQQRVGVARALAADPPVMLLDEPFGALDPITRDRLQSELLKIQQTVRKTMVFVTHDIDEAMKMGDRVAILRDRSKIAQFAPPDEILANPADDYVSQFIGGGAAVRRLHLVRVGDAEVGDWTTAGMAEAPAEVAARVDRDGRDWVVLLDEDRRPRGWGPRAALQGASDLRSVSRPVDFTVGDTSTLHDAMDEMLTSSHGAAIVVHEDGRFRGVLTMEGIVGTLRGPGAGSDRRGAAA